MYPKKRVHSALVPGMDATLQIMMSIENANKRSRPEGEKEGMNTAVGHHQQDKAKTLTTPTTKKQKTGHEQKCAACQEILPLDEFSKNQRKKGCLSKCKSCVASSVGPGVPHNKNTTTNANTMVCGSCLQNKHLSKNQRKLAPLGRCIDCAKENKPLNKELLERDDSIQKKCPKCKETKPKKLFSQLKNNICLTTLNKECRDCIIKEEVERQRRLEIEREKYRMEQARKEEFLESLPPQRKMPTFEYPFDDGYIENFTGDESDSEIEEGSKRRPILKYQGVGTSDNLVGTHDLVFMFTQSDGLPLNREIMGTVVFTKEEEEEQDDQEERQQSQKAKEGGSINGIVLLDKSIKRSLQQQWADWKFKMKSKFLNTFEVTNMDDPLQHEDSKGRKCRGRVHIVTEDKVLPYTPEGDKYYWTKHHRTYLKSFPRDIPSAKKIIEDYQSGQSLQLKWLSKLPTTSSTTTKLPEEVTRLISQFATSKPPPALILEKGDILLEFPWYECFHGDSYVEYLVARPRKNK